jgi:cytochrome b561
MTLRNTGRSWGTISKALHWIIVLLIINQWVIAEHAEGLKLSEKIPALNLHKSFGILILALAIIRLVWRWMNPVPELATQAKPWERALAHLSHILLYGLIFALPLTGWMMSSAKNTPVSWFKLFQLPDLVAPDKALGQLLLHWHHGLFDALVIVAAIHILGALKHAIIDRNEVLKRMLPFTKSTGEAP